MYDKLTKITAAAAVIYMFSISASAEETCLTLDGNAKAVYVQTINAVIDSIVETKDDVKIYFIDSTTGIEYVSWSDEAHVRFSLGGRELSYSDLMELDVVTLSYNVLFGTKDGIVIDYCVGGVSRDVVCDYVTAYDEASRIVTVGDYEYTMLEMSDMYMPEIYVDYTFRLNADGNIVYIDTVYGHLRGFIVEMYKKKDAVNPVIKMIHLNGNIEEYECKNQKEALKFYNFIANTIADDDIKPTEILPKQDVYFTKEMAKEAIVRCKTMCRCFVIRDNMVMFDRAELPNAGGRNLKYDYSISRIGPYSVPERYSTIIDMHEYISDDKVKVISSDELENEHEYDMYFFGANRYGDYRYGVWV